MGKFKLYNVDLKNLTPGIHEFEYLLENKFFVDIDGDQVQKGKVKVNLTVKRSSMMFEMNFQIEGVVMVPCDRCLDDMELPIDTHNRLVVKFGKEYAEEDRFTVRLTFTLPFWTWSPSISTKNLFSNKYSNSCIPGVRFFKSTLYNLNFPKAF